MPSDMVFRIVSACLFTIIFYNYWINTIRLILAVIILKFFSSPKIMCFQAISLLSNSFFVIFRQKLDYLPCFVTRPSNCMKTKSKFRKPLLQLLKRSRLQIFLAHSILYSNNDGNFCSRVIWVILICHNSGLKSICISLGRYFLCQHSLFFVIQL